MSVPEEKIVTDVKVIARINMRQLIVQKKHGEEHSEQELRFLVEGIAAGEIPDYQISAWLMAVYFRGLASQELASLTDLMRRSGISYQFANSSGTGSKDSKLVDKHSTGGVGDKISFILAPLAVCLGYRVPMIAGRTLGHTGGTIDKLESILGYKTDYEDEEKLKTFLKNTGMFIISQSQGLCPADRKLYALRDVTETVDQQDLICASIVSKKLAEGTEHVVYDVKCGSGAFMPDLAKARGLAEALVNLSRLSGLKATALITDMSFPLGRLLGNAAEVMESLQILKSSYGNEEQRSLSEPVYLLTLRLLYSLVKEAGDRRSQGELRQICDEAIKTGKAYEVFARSCQQQGAALDALKNLEMAPLQAEILAEEDGVLQVLDAGGIGRAGLLLGMGRLTQEDKISHGNCFEILRRKGAAVKKGMPLLRIYAADHLQQIPAVVALIRKGILIDSGPAPDYAKDLVLDSIQ